MPTLTLEQQNALLSQRDLPQQSDFTDVKVPEMPDVPGMVSAAETRYLYWLTSQCYTGRGAVVEVGTWLGRSTSHLAAGLNAAGYHDHLHCFDRFQWTKTQSMKIQLPLNNGDSFQPYFEQNIRPMYPNLHVTPVAGDFTREAELPRSDKRRPAVGYFPGSTIGNFGPDDAVALMRRIRIMLGSGSAFIVGVDLAKDRETLEAAYDDAGGVTAAFNKNVLQRINRELGGDVPVDAFAHRAVWNPLESRVEMHLEALRTLKARAAGREFAFVRGETIHTENSYKFTPEGFGALAERAGWRTVRQWISPAPEVAVFLLTDR